MWSVFLRSMLHLLVPANVVHSSLNIFTLLIEAICSCENSILTRATRLHIPEDGILQRVVLSESAFIRLLIKQLLHGDPCPCVSSSFDYHKLHVMVVWTEVELDNKNQLIRFQKFNRHSKCAEGTRIDDQ
jgi:hypothetical protein